jgi:hypothetical protein
MTTIAIDLPRYNWRVFVFLALVMLAIVLL